MKAFHSESDANQTAENVVFSVAAVSSVCEGKADHHCLMMDV